MAYSSLRLVEPACDLDEGWSQETLKTQASRVLNMLLELTTEPPEGRNELLLAPSFAYCFYLLRGILLGEVSHWGQELFLGALDIISAHAKLRAEKDDEEEIDEVSMCVSFNSFRPKQNGSHFAGHIFECIFFK